jgi:hypothetical protein
MVTSNHVRAGMRALLAMLLISLAAREASAQGCILFRESAPLFGPLSGTYLQPGEWEVTGSLRGSTADRHYSGDVYQAQRTALGTYVINKQRLALFNVNHAFTTRLSAAVSVPLVVASWSIPSPIAPPGPRGTQHGHGLGDISVMGRYWLFDPVSRSRYNISLGAGLKMPTGNADDTDVFPDITGVSPSDKAVDQSVQPGDGGWGGQFEVQGFSRFGRIFVFGSANYLASPRDMNDTPSILVGIGRPSTTTPLRNVNSVPDQYLVRTGVGMPVWRGISASLAWRVEGVPRYDVVGKSYGFRRPGREMFIEPGVSFVTGQSTFQLNLPHAYYRYRAPDPYTGAAGDAAFPDWVVLGTYSYRFGKTKHAAGMPVATAGQPQK